MNYITTLQLIIRFILGLLLALFPMYTTMAQEAPKPENKLRIKYIRNINGVETVKDTTIIITEMATSLPSFSRLKADTAELRKLTSSGFNTFNFDTEPMGLKARSFRIVHLNDSLTANQGEELLKQLRTQQNDSTMKILVRSGKVQVLQGDSVRVTTFDRAASPKAITFEGTNPRSVYMLRTDSVKTFKYTLPDSIKNLNPAKIERIYIRKNDKSGLSDSVVFKSDGRSTFTIITSDSTGYKRILKSGEAVDEQVLHQFEVQPGKTITVVMRKVTVQDLTAEDVSALKSTGTPVETKPKNELELEEIEYYPNPSDGKFNLRFKPENTATTIVRVLDSKGREVFAETIENLKGEYDREIDLTPYGKGLYFLQIAQGKRYHTKKILIR